MLTAAILLRVKGIIAAKGNNRIILQPDEDEIDADGIIKVELCCGETAADQFRLGSTHEFNIGGSLFGRVGNGER